jgi:endonuclease/exonuclease/phosphatase family metal-dependent hydrolase
MRNKLLRYACLGVIYLLGSPSLAQTQTVDVLTWNVAKPWTTAEVDAQMDFVAAMTPRPDIIVLQEVRDTLKLRYRDRLKQQTAEPWDQYEFAPYCLTAGSAGSCAQSGTTGVMVLTRFPKESSEGKIFWYADQYLDGRSAVRMAVNVSGTIANVFSHHLPADTWDNSAAEETRRQMAVAIKHWALEVAPDTPRLLGGDFNAKPHQPAITPPDGMTGPTDGVYEDAWVAAPGTGSANTHVSGARVDYWFADAAGSAQAIYADVRESAPHSDHLPVLVTYEISPSSPQMLKVNFQPAASPVPSGYLADTGLPFAARGNGWSYGWNADNTTQTRDRNAANSPDQRYDTLAYMQRPENPNASWEVAVPNGTYRVRVVAGDPSFYNNQVAIAAEGVVVVNGLTTSAQPWLDGTATVTVSDGRLTIGNATGADGNKICFIDITREIAKVNFQPAASPVPSGYLADTGLAFAARGNGWSYGWNIDNTTQMRDRNAANSPDQRYDTLAYMQRPENPNGSWEITLPNGTYQVRVVAGDPSFYNNQIVIAAEGIVVVNGLTTSAQPWLDGTSTVTVADGRLTIANATGADGNKICFIDITQ